MSRPLAPHPIKPADGPHFQPLQNTYPLKSTRSRRGTINAACNECRLKKLKCDGVRPRCRRCIEKGVDVCEYTVNPGETRFTALKRKNANLVSDSDRMRNFIEALRSASPSEAQSLLQNLRTCDDPANALELLTLPLPLPQSQPQSQSQQQFQPLVCSDSDPSSSSAQPSSDTTPTTNASLESPTLLSDITGPSSQPPSSGFEHDILPIESSLQPFADFGTQLPSHDALKACVCAFYNEAGKMFHVFPLEQIESHFVTLAGQGDKQARRLAACELSAVAAIGSQYIKDVLTKGTERRMYSIAKHLLEDVVTIDSLRAAKVCALLGMFNIMSKEKVAMTFVEMGLNLLQRPSMTQICPSNVEQNRWVSARKTWRVLIFLESWLSSTLGYVSGLQLPPGAMNAKTFEIEGEVDLEEKITTEMIKIAVIKFDMLRMSLSFKGLSAQTIETINKDLQYWHQGLPQEMRLTELENNPQISFELRRTIYYVNFLYFGAQIMLLRRVLQSLNEQSNSLRGDEAAVDDLLRHAHHAARESAKLFKRLCEEGDIVKRCWICIFQAYSSCVLILFEVAQALYQNTSGHVNEDLNLAIACITFLSICSSKDQAAGQFVKTLTPYYETLYAMATSQTIHEAELSTTACALRDLVGRPFKTASEESPEVRYLWKQQQEQRQNMDEFVFNTTNHPLDQGLPGDLACIPCDNWQGIDSVRNDGTIHDLLSAIRPGHFLPGFESEHVWTGDINAI